MLNSLQIFLNMLSLEPLNVFFFLKRQLQPPIMCDCAEMYWIELIAVIICSYPMLCHPCSCWSKLRNDALGSHGAPLQEHHFISMTSKSACSASTHNRSRHLDANVWMPRMMLLTQSPCCFCNLSVRLRILSFVKALWGFFPAWDWVWMPKSGSFLMQ